MGHVEAGIVLEEIGRNLTPSPFLTSSVLAATALKHGFGLTSRIAISPTPPPPGLITGDSVFAVAIDETAKHRPYAYHHPRREVGQRLPPDRFQELRHSWQQL